MDFGQGFELRRTAIYLGTVEYIEKAGENPFYRRMIGGVAIQQYYPSTGVRQTHYLLKDHLGSIHTVADDTGAVVQRHRYDAFGHRVDVMDWQTPLITPGQFGSFNSITNRGFTGHEHADAQGVIQTR